MTRKLFFVVFGLSTLINCGPQYDPENGAPESTQDPLQIDQQTGVPYANTYQYPIQGFNASDFGFGFGSMNDLICMSRDKDGQCLAFGYHLAHDSLVGRTPYGKEVLAPADGIVRVTTDLTFRGYGSTSSGNSNYYGCVLVLEHEFPDGSPFTTLLGHVQCESTTNYDPAARIGNPARGTIVRRGQYVGHVGHYWYGAGKTTDWHHVHWGNRKGAFTATSYTRSGVGVWVRGYAARSEFSKDPQTGKLVHPEWFDPIDTVKKYGDPALTPDVGVRHHPPGSMLEDQQGTFWLVTNEAEIAKLPTAVIASDHYDTSLAARASQDELDCYAHAADIKSFGSVTLYQRPGTHTVVMAYDDKKERYDVIRQEALYSWGYNFQGLTTDASKIQKCENAYAARGFRQLRPGSLIKADEESEVSIVTPWQTRRPIGTGEIYEKLGYSWDRIMSVPYDVIDAVAGVRESNIVDYDSIFACALPAPCPSDGMCGGGDDPEDYVDDVGDVSEQDAGASTEGGTEQLDSGAPAEASATTESCNGLDDDGNGQIDEIFMCRLGAVGGGCVTSCGSAGYLVCTAPACSWGECHSYPEDCSNTIDDDCNGLVDCADPACAKDANCQTEADAGMLAGQIRFIYDGPASPGSIKLMAWWQPPETEPRIWDEVTDCLDAVPDDGRFDCTFLVPSGTGPLEFQVNLPDGSYWGDESCDQMGGCGSTIGTTKVYGSAGELEIKMVPNNDQGQPYYNGHIDSVP